MSLPFTEEMLSAYLDGEATPEECALVERLLDEKPELRDQLNALTDLSQTVQKLPRESAPAGFAVSVLEEVNQRRPSRPKPQTKEVVPASAKTSRRSPRFWISSLAALSILVVAGVLLKTSPQATSISDMASLEKNSNMQGDRGEAGETAVASDMMVAETITDAEMGDSNSSFGMPAAPSRERFAGMGLATKSPNSPKIITLDRKEIASRLNSLSESPELGDELSILTKDNETPILVDFVVVDVQKSWNQLQVLLKQHSIKPVMIDPNRDGTSPDSKGEMIAIYLDLDEPALENVLGQVNALDAVLFVPEESRHGEYEDLLGGMKSAASPSLSFTMTKNSKEEQESRSLTAASTNSPANQSGHTQERQFSFDIQNALSKKKLTVPKGFPARADQTSQLVRSKIVGSKTTAGESKSARLGLPRSPTKPERLATSEASKEKTKATAGTRNFRNRPTPPKTVAKPQALPAAAMPDGAEAPALKQLRSAKKSTEHVRALLIFRQSQK